MSTQPPSAAENIAVRTQKGLLKLRETFKKNPHLHSGQKPKLALVICSDSRAHEIISAEAGEVFVYRNIGNSLENSHNPQTLSDDARDFLTYAHHLGVETLVIFSHGKCGCIANACKCADTPVPQEDGGLEKNILRQMGDRKRFIVDLVKTKGVEFYLSKIDLPYAPNPAEARLIAVEIGHGIYMADLAKKFLKELDSKMQVEVGYFDIRSCDVYLHRNAAGKFQKIDQ